VALDLGAVVAFEGLGELLQEGDEFGRRLGWQFEG